MHVLVLGRPSLERTKLTELLARADASVEICHDGSWGCTGMNRTCPLDRREVSVAVAVPEPSGRFDPQGVACAHRARIPIVTVGADENDPVLDFATKHVSHVDQSVVGALRAAARDASGHERAVVDELHRFLADDERVRVAARRDHDHISVVVAGHFDGARAAAVADHARAAVRAHDPHAAVIDVSLVDADVDPATAINEP